VNKFEVDFNVKTAECAGYFAFFTLLKMEKAIISNRMFYC